MTDIRRTIYSPSDKNEVLLLLEEAFGAEYRAYYEVQLRTLTSEKDTFIYTVDDQLVAHLQVVQYMYRSGHTEYPMAYLYAICTDQRMRGQGVMSRVVMPDVLNDVYARGYIGAFLVPASESLVSFYQPMGFRKMNTGAHGQETADIPCITPSERALEYLRQIEVFEPSKLTKSQEIKLEAGWMLHTNGPTPISDSTVIITPLT